MAYDCRRYAPALSRFADGQLGEAEREGLERHAQTCASCARVLSEYRALNALLVAPAPIEPDPYLWLKLRQRLAAERKAQPRSILARLRPVLIPLAAAALVVVAVFTASTLSRTITATTQEAAIRAVNEPPEDARPAVSESIPSFLEDTLEDE